MANPIGSSEEVVITRMGDIYFFPCADAPPQIHKLACESHVDIARCEGKPYFAVVISRPRFHAWTPIPDDEQRTQRVEEWIARVIQEFWDYLVFTRQVEGDLPAIVDGFPQRMLAPNEVFVT